MKQDHWKHLNDSTEDQQVDQQMHENEAIADDLNEMDQVDDGLDPTDQGLDETGKKLQDHDDERESAASASTSAEDTHAPYPPNSALHLYTNPGSSESSIPTDEETEPGEKPEPTKPDQQPDEPNQRPLHHPDEQPDVQPPEQPDIVKPAHGPIVPPIPPMSPLEHPGEQPTPEPPTKFP